MHCVGVPARDSISHRHSHHSSGGVVEMVATAARTTVSNVIGMIGTEVGLSVQTEARKCNGASPRSTLCRQASDLFCRSRLSVSIAPLDKADAPLILEAYIYLLSVQCLVSLSDGLTGYNFSLYNTLTAQKPPTGSTEPVHAPSPLDPPRDHASPHWATNCARDAELRLTLLVILSFLFTTLSDPLLGGVLGAADARSRHGQACLIAHVTRSLLCQGRTPHGSESWPRSTNRNTPHLRFASPSSVSIGIHARFGGSWCRTPCAGL